MGYSFVSHGGKARTSTLIVDSNLDMDGFDVVGAVTVSAGDVAATGDVVVAGEIIPGISKIPIDVGKDWNGKSITNVDLIQAATISAETPTLSVYTNFVDVPGGTLRKTIAFSKSVYTNDTYVELLSFTVPSTYSSTHDSNCRIIVSKSTSSYLSHVATVQARIGGTTIGSGTAAHNVNSVTVNTTGNFRAGQTITLWAKVAAGNSSYDRNYSFSNCRIYSSRATNIPILAKYSEEAW